MIGTPNSSKQHKQESSKQMTSTVATSSTPYIPESFIVPGGETWVKRPLSRSGVWTIRISALIISLFSMIIATSHFAITLATDSFLIILKNHSYRSPLRPRNYGPEFGILGLPYIFNIVVFVASIIPIIFVFSMFGRQLDFSLRGPTPMRRRWFSVICIHFLCMLLPAIYYISVTVSTPFFIRRAYHYWAVFCSEPGFEGYRPCISLRICLRFMNAMSATLFLLTVAQFLFLLAISIIRFRAYDPQVVNNSAKNGNSV